MYSQRDSLCILIFAWSNTQFLRCQWNHISNKKINWIKWQRLNRWSYLANEYSSGSHISRFNIHARLSFLPIWCCGFHIIEIDSIESSSVNYEQKKLTETLGSGHLLRRLFESNHSSSKIKEWKHHKNQYIQTTMNSKLWAQLIYQAWFFFSKKSTWATCSKNRPVKTMQVFLFAPFSLRDFL